MHENREGWPVPFLKLSPLSMEHILAVTKFSLRVLVVGFIINIIAGKSPNKRLNKILMPKGFILPFKAFDW